MATSWVWSRQWTLRGQSPRGSCRIAASCSTKAADGASLPRCLSGFALEVASPADRKSYRRGPCHAESRLWSAWLSPRSAEPSEFTIAGTWRSRIDGSLPAVALSKHAVVRSSMLKPARAGLFIVHGAGGGFDQGIAFGADLARRGLRTIAMSRFGYLRTPMPADASAAAQATAHVCLLDALGIESAAVIGASAGAPSAMQMAVRYPDRVGALVLAVPATYVPRPGNLPPLTTPRGTEFLFSTALRSDFVFWTARHVMPNTLLRAILATPPADLRTVNHAEHIPNARFVGYATGGHIWAGHQEELLTEIVSFLEGHLAPVVSRPDVTATAPRRARRDELMTMR